MTDTAGAGLLLVTRNFPPLRGGMERLNQRLLQGLADSRPVALVGPAGCAEHAPSGTEVAELRISPLPWFLVSGALHAARLARRLRPGVVLAGSGLMVPVAWLAARLVDARLAAYLHGLDIVAANPLYRAIWKPWLARCDLVFANSANTARLAREAGVAAARIRIVHPGTDIPALVPQAASAFRAKHELGDVPLLLSVGRLTPRKGLAEFVRDVLPRIATRLPDVRLLVMGHDPAHALKRSRQPESERIATAVQASSMQRNVVWLPPCADEELATVYQACDAHVFPVRALAGDVEGFGMVAIEAAANGIPTVAYAVDGVPDAVVEGLSGRLVDAGDAEGFADAVVAMTQARRDPAWSARCREAAGRYAWARFHQRMADALNAHEGMEGDDGR